MGADIHGWVEVNRSQASWWDGIILIDGLVERHYPIFASLFGVRNFGDFESVAADKRGLPADISRQAKQDFEDWDTDAHSSSWIGWQELTDIDWNEKVIDFWKYGGSGRDEATSTVRVHGDTARAIKDKLGIPVSAEYAEWIDIDYDHPLLDELNVKITRQKMIDRQPGWKLLFAMMKQLAEVYGNEGVRLVVWFDN